eukprot:g13000.t1
MAAPEALRALHVSLYRCVLRSARRLDRATAAARKAGLLPPLVVHDIRTPVSAAAADLGVDEEGEVPQKPLEELDWYKQNRQLAPFRRFLPPELRGNKFKTAQEMVLASRRAWQPRDSASPHLLVQCMLEAMRLASFRAASMEDEGWSPKPANVKFDVGQRFLHKKFRYRGVVVKWYPTCPANATWQRSFGPWEHGGNQPFYHCLVDKVDRPLLLETLAAQENLIPAEEHEREQGVEPRAISHPEIDKYFDNFQHGRHIMTKELANKNPDDVFFV